MGKNAKIFLMFLCLVLSQNAFAFEFKNPFKKQEEPKAKMVETKQEWEEQSVNVPLEQRKIIKQVEEKDPKKFIIPEFKYVFEKYNYPQGKRELNVVEVRSKLAYYPYLVADNNCRYVAYPFYYYSPATNQISSNFYVEKLDTSKTKQKRILDYNHKQKERIPIIEAGTKETYQNLFNGLTLVDWSKDSSKLLIKEKVGSSLGGIYKTYLYVHYLADDVNAGRTVKLDRLDKAIRYYYTDWEKRQIVKYRYDIIPLGFSADNDNIIILLCYVYDKNGNKLFLGQWGYNCETEAILLLSKKEFTPKISSNGLILKQVLD